jgi:trehalose 6-phosphate synthase
MIGKDRAVPRLIIASNRVPNPGARGAEAAGGLAVALREGLARQGGIWFGWSGEAAAVPAATPRLRRSGSIEYAVVDLTPEDVEGYYSGFANATLWPLLHYRLGLVDYRRSAAEAYVRVNRQFAAQLAPLVQPGDVIWVHDYHLIPLARELRQCGLDNPIGFFLHTPFPPAEVVGALPGAAALLAAFTSYDVVGVQTGNDARLLGEAVRRLVPAASWEGGLLRLAERSTRLVAAPVSIDAERYRTLAQSAAGTRETATFVGSLAGRKLIIGVDRLDYSKGLPQRFQSYAELLERHPEHRAQVTYLQLAPVSRDGVAEYRQLRRELEQLCGAVNGRFSELDWNPLRYLNRTVGRAALAGLYRAAAVGLVTPLRDGMNLVAKEYVAAQDPADPGVLVLSRFAGAAAELTGALLVNPLDVEEVRDALHRALRMPLEERIDRWHLNRSALDANTVSDWFDGFVQRLRTGPAAASASETAHAAVAADLP